MDGTLGIFTVIAVLALLELFRSLRHIEAKIDRLMALQGMGSTGCAEPSSGVATLVAEGETVAALRLYRSESGADIKQALKVIEAMQLPSRSNST